MTNSLSMRRIERSLQCIGLPVCSWDYPSRRRTIQEHACNLVCYLQQIAEANPEVPISFVTHSTGALVLRATLNTPGCPEEAKMGRAALLAPPNQGSSLAHRFRNVLPVNMFMGEKSGRELMCYDTCAIQAFGPFPKTMQILVIAGTRGNPLLFCEPNDGYVTVQETALETPHYWTSFPLRHGELITNSYVLQCLDTFIYWGYPESESDETDPDCKEN